MITFIYHLSLSEKNELEKMIQNNDDISDIIEWVNEKMQSAFDEGRNYGTN